MIKTLEMAHLDTFPASDSDDTMLWERARYASACIPQQRYHRIVYVCPTCDRRVRCTSPLEQYGYGRTVDDCVNEVPRDIACIWCERRSARLGRVRVYLATLYERCV